MFELGQQLIPALLSWYLIPANIHAITCDHIESMRLQYEHGLPSISTFDQEVHRWRALCESNDNQQRISLSGALRLALSTTGLFQNIETVLSLLLSLPVGSCCCERTLSTMWRLKTRQRISSMGNARFNGLALMNIRSDKMSAKLTWTMYCTD